MLSTGSMEKSGFSYVSEEELMNVNGGNGFTFNNGIGYSFDLNPNVSFNASANCNGSYSGNWNNGLSFSSGNGHIASVNLGPVTGFLDSVTIGIHIKI